VIFDAQQDAAPMGLCRAPDVQRVDDMAEV
jgi:hypothetical protein